MSLIPVLMNLMLAGLLLAALGMGWRLNGRLKALRDSHDGFAIAVRELNAAAARAEQGLADLRAATDEAVDELADRIEKGRALATRLQRLIDDAPETPVAAPRMAREGIVPDDIRSAERRLGALLAAAREGRPERAREPLPERAQFREPPAAPPPRRLTVEDDLFEDEPLILDAMKGGRR